MGLYPHPQDPSLHTVSSVHPRHPFHPLVSLSWKARLPALLQPALLSPGCAVVTLPGLLQLRLAGPSWGPQAAEPSQSLLGSRGGGALAPWCRCAAWEHIWRPWLSLSARAPRPRLELDGQVDRWTDGRTDRRAGIWWTGCWTCHRSPQPERHTRRCLGEGTARPSTPWPTTSRVDSHPGMGSQPREDVAAPHPPLLSCTHGRCD